MAGVQKKFVIKSFKNQHVMNIEDAQKTFAMLESAIDEIYNNKASDLRFEELYRSGYNLVLNKHGNLLYNGLAESVRRHLIVVIYQLLATPSDTLLQSLAKTWNEHKIVYTMIKDIMMYVDRTYVTQHRKPPVYNMAVLIFREVIFYHPEIRERVRTILLNHIESERKGCLIDRSLLKEILSMLGDFSLDGVNVYEEDFERHFLIMTRSFYHQESQEVLCNNNCPEYILKAESRLIEESMRVRHYLSFSTEPKLRSLVEYEFITCHVKSLIEMENSGTVVLMKTDRLVELKKLYQLFSYVPSTLEYLRDAMGQYINQYGVEIIAEQNSIKDPINFVQKMLDFKSKFDVIIKQCFQEEKKSYKKLKESFENFMNIDDKCASYLASYIDDLLKSSSLSSSSSSISTSNNNATSSCSSSSSTNNATTNASNTSNNTTVTASSSSSISLRGLSESEIELQFDRVMTLFKYLNDKDIFEGMYRTHFSKRLLTNKSISDDLEKLMITKLKNECGQQFTSKIEGMFLDMHLGKEIMEIFHNSPFHAKLSQLGSAAATTTVLISTQSTSSSLLQSSSSLPSSASAIELEVQTLTASHWAMKPHPPCILPAIATAACDVFTQFYTDRFKTGRRLTWLTHVGTVDMKVNFPLGRRELNISTYQMCILMLFNENTKLTLEQIRNHTNIAPEAELRRHLLSLCTPKIRILKKSSTGKGIEDDDVITFNDEFTSKFRRIKIPLISTREVTLEEVEAVSSAAEEDRRHLIEAAIVRIMKARRRLSHTDLLAEATRQLSMRFQPTPLSIKKRLESLIEREYLQRDKEDSRFYNYLA